MKKYKEKFRYLDARLKISFVAFCILAFLLVLCLDREWIFSEGFWKIAMIFLLVLLVGFTYLWIWKPYRRLINQVQRFSDGYISLADLTDVEVAISPEFERMARHMNKIVTATRTLDMSKRQAQYRALQNQINPHFLYNSLSIINWKAIEAGEDEISHVTLALSTYYRTSLNRGETMTTVAKEIDNIRAYLKIQLVMHDNEFRVVEQISDGLNDYLIPKLILQPLAENAIDHGIDVSDNENPTLWLTIREEAEHIFFEIRDNGAGMTQEKADQILTYQSSGYGVRNVCDRIHVLYGEKGEMKIESTPGKGTRVFIRIPKNTEAKVL